MLHMRSSLSRSSFRGRRASLTRLGPRSTSVGCLCFTTTRLSFFREEEEEEDDSYMRTRRSQLVASARRSHEPKRCYSTAATVTSSWNNGLSHKYVCSSSPACLQGTYHRQMTARHKSVFVSKYNQSFHLTAKSILDYFNSHGISVAAARSTATHVILRECPFCTKPTRGKADNMYKCYIQIGAGGYFCHRCGSGGSWFDLKMKLSGFEVTDLTGGHHHAASGNAGPMQPSSAMVRSTNSRTSSAVEGQFQSFLEATRSTPATQDTPCLPMPCQGIQAVYSTNLLDSTPMASPASSSSTTTQQQVSNPSSIGGTTNRVLTYLERQRKLTHRTLRKYGVGRAYFSFRDGSMKNGGSQWTEAECVTFPWVLPLSAIQYQEELRGAKFVCREMEQEPRSRSSSSASEHSSTDTIRPGLVAASVAPENYDDDGNDDNDIHFRQEATDDGTTVRCVEKLDPQGEDDGTLTMAPISSRSDNATDDSSNASSRPALADAGGHEAPPPVDDTKDEKFFVRRIKIRALDNKAWQRLDPPGGGWGLFGYHTVPSECREVVLTEGEYDAMSVWQATGRPAVSLPNGCRSLPVEVLPLLEKFEKIYLWMDLDAPGQEGARLFARKLGLNRCYLVQPTEGNVGGDDLPKDANEALQRGLDLERIIQDAARLPHEHILTFQQLRSQVLQEIYYPEQYIGVPLPSLPTLTNIVKGFRRGELTVVTGPTGSGKTTLLGQISLDLAEQDVKVLWGSFEIKNTRLLRKLMQQYAREPFPVGDPGQADKLEAIADRFQQLPLYFMKFHGGSDVDDVLDAMDYACYVNDVEHIILDNMQFMISRQSQHSSFDKFDMQDIAIEKFRKFATDRNVHVTLVVHPRKEQEDSKLSLASIYGSAKATQEADTVLIIQSDGRKKYVEVKKNRFDGTLGHAELYFDRHSCRYAETPVLPTNAGSGDDRQHHQRYQLADAKYHQPQAVSQHAATKAATKPGRTSILPPDPWESMFT